MHARSHPLVVVRNKCLGLVTLFFFFDLRSKSVEAIVARFASKKLDSRFLLGSLELPPKSCTAEQQSSSTE